MAVADVDLEKLTAERRRSNTWRAGEWCMGHLQTIDFSFTETGEGASVGGESIADAPDQPAVLPAEDTELLLNSALDVLRPAPRMPFVPADPTQRAASCEEILDLQAAGLKTRLAHTGTRSAVIGLSGGLDSTLALLVTVRAFDMLGLSRTGVHAVSMPGFGTTGRTKSNAERLAEQLGVDFRTIAIGEAVRAHFADIGHDPSVTDVTYENAQARERTQVLMDLSNELGGFVIGTGDLSELALGWATYNADHMSMYGVNAGVPKTLVRPYEHVWRECRRAQDARAPSGIARRRFTGRGDGCDLARYPRHARLARAVAAHGRRRDRTVHRGARRSV